MRWLLLLTLAAALFMATSASPVLRRRNEASLRTRTSAVGGHLRLPSTIAGDGDTMLLSGAGDGKEKAVSSNDDDDDDEDRKTLAQQIADGKYGLLQNEIYTSAPERPGVISYDSNPEVPRDTAKNLGGLEQDEIWLAEDHVLVLRGGRYPDHKPNRTKPAATWPPIDNYKAPPRQVKIPSNPKVPPPFPVQLIDDGPTQLLGPNGSKPIIIPPGNGSYFAPPFPFPPPPPGNFTPENGPFYPPPPYFGYPPPGSLPSAPPPFQPSTNQSVYGQPPFPIPPSGNFTPGNGPPPFYPFPFPPPIRNGSLYPPPPGFFPPPRNGSFIPPPGFLPPPPFGNGSLPPGFFPPPPGYFPPGAAFLPPPRILNDTFDEDDPSIYYPPPYDFFYPRDNTTQVPPGPLVPGIILPPPPNFFAPLNDSSSTRRTTTTSTTTAAPSTTTSERPASSIPKPPMPFPSRKKKPFRPSPPPSDDTVAFNQVTTEIPLRYYSKTVKGIVISTPSPVTYVVVPVTDINISPQSPNKHSPFLVYKTSTVSGSNSNRNRETQYQGRGGISTSISPPLQYQRAPKTSYYFYEEPQVAQGHLSEAGVLKSQQGYYRDGYYYDPPAGVSTPSPQVYYNLPIKSTTPGPPVYYIPSRSPTPAPQAYYSKPAKSSTPNLSAYYSAPNYQTPASNLYYNNAPTPAPPLYYYVNARPQQQPQQQYYSTPRPQYQDIQEFKSNLQYYNGQGSPFVSSRPVYQFSYDAQGPSTSTPRTSSPVAIQFASTPRPASTPRTVYEYSYEKQPPNEIGGAYTTALSPVLQQFIGPTVRPQYQSNSQFVQPTSGPLYAVPMNSPVSTERPQYLRPTVNPPHVRPTIRPGAPFGLSTPNPQHAYYTPHDERLLDDITKKYFTIFGQKLGGGGGTTPMPPTHQSYQSTTPQPISLEGDTAVNYHPPLPAIEPESELVEPAGGPRLSNGELISYRLPGNDAHFYFLTPQARQRYRRRKTPR